MKRSLRKGAELLHVRYAGTFTNNLFGRNFTIESDGDSITIEIDLGPNLRTRNKSTNTYVDATDLAERHHELEAVDIGPGDVFNRLGATMIDTAVRRGRRSLTYLVLSFGERGRFSYPVDVTLMKDAGVRLAVRR